MSPKFSLNLRDLIHGFLMAALGSILTALVPMLESGLLPDWPKTKAALIVGLGVGVVYLIKNYISNSSGQITKPD